MSFEEYSTPPKQGEGEKSAKKTGKQSSKFARNLRRLALLGTLTMGHVPEATLSYEEKLDIAKQEMEASGITGEQRQVYKPGANDLLRRIVDPFSKQSTYYGLDIKEEIKRIPENWKRDEKSQDLDHRASEDAWRLYLGIPQENNSIGISDFRPTKSTEDKFYYKINNFLDIYNKGVTLAQKIQSLVNYANHEGDYDPEMKTYIDTKPSGIGVLGKFTVTLGEDEGGHYISYYDIWDLNVPIENTTGLIGKPFEIYDRLYYDPKTFEPTGLIKEGAK